MSVLRRKPLNLNELGQRMKDAANWRTRFERHPAVFLGAAVVGGILLSGLIGSRSRQSTPRRFVSHTARRTARATELPAPSAVANLWSEAKGAVASALGTQVYSVLREFIRGVEQRAEARMRTHDRTAEPRTRV